MFSDILIPSRSIAQMYEAYVVETQSGQILEGVIGGRASTAVALVHEQQKKDVVPRAGIKQMYVSNLRPCRKTWTKRSPNRQRTSLPT